MLTRYEVTLLPLRALKVNVTHVSRSFSHLSSYIQDIALSSRDVEKTSDGCVFSVAPNIRNYFYSTACVCKRVGSLCNYRGQYIRIIFQ